MKIKDYGNKNELLNEIQFEYNNFPWKPILAYVLVGFLWIVFSDVLLASVVNDYNVYMKLQSYKGGFYVIVTAIMLFFLIRLDNSKTIKLANIIAIRNQELASFSEELIATEDELSQKVSRLNITIDDLNSEKQFVDEIFNSCNTAIMVWKLNGEIIEINNHFTDILGFDGKEIIGKKWFDFIIPSKERAIVSQLFNELKQNYNVKNFENKVITKDNRILDMLWNDSVIHNSKTHELAVVSYGIDITAERHNEKKAFELAFKDRLTGFDNRTVFEKDITKLIDSNEPFILYYLDIDNFRNLNEIHGHHYGDLFLKEFSLRIQHKLEGRFLYRWCGDEFMILEKVSSTSCIDSVVEQIFESSEEKWCHEHIEYHPSVSIGIAKYPEDGKSREDIFKNIDIALHHSKSLGNSYASKYCSSFQSKIETKIAIENAIHNALLVDGFELNYQPIFNLSTNDISAIEVLLRWRPDTYKYSTSEFISVAEETGQILKIDHWVIRNTFEFISNNLKNSPITVSINLSARTICSSETIRFLRECLYEYKIDAAKIEFEITEHSLIDDITESLELVNSLKTLGFKISLDDFGTRYSSLNYLSIMPFDYLKIDKTYVDKIVDLENDLIIVDQIIQLSKKLGLKTIAEGIETSEQLELLSNMGCDFGQGYLMAKPLKESILISLIEAC